MEGRQNTCYKHGRPYELLGNDQKCDLNCQICCDCLRGMDHGHKKDIVNHQTISMEQLAYHFDKIQKYNSDKIQECSEALDQYFRSLQMLLREQVHREKERLTKTLKKIMLTQITRDQAKLEVMGSLIQRDYTNVKCRQVGQISRQLLSFIPKSPSAGFHKFIEYIKVKQGQLHSEFKEIIQSKPFYKTLLKRCEQQIKFPHFQQEPPQQQQQQQQQQQKLKVSRVRTQQKESPKKTLRRSIKREPKPNLMDLKQISIQLKRPLELIGSKLLDSRQDSHWMGRLWEHRRPEGGRLLFRASENNFSVKAFHQHCDNETDTLVVVQTEFGKIIGGFTPLSWKSTANTLHSDIKCESFLFSLSLKQKMGLIDDKSAIFNSANFGPTFGAGADLAICHNGHIEKTSYSQFPYSYANPRYKQNNQHSTALFIGQKNGNHFLLKQWEVWKINFFE